MGSLSVVGFYRGDNSHLDPQPLDWKTVAAWNY